MINKEKYNFNKIIDDIGDFGRFQILLIVASFLTILPGASNIPAGVFFSFHEYGRCKTPLENTNLTHENLTKLFIPQNSSYVVESTSCKMYTTNKCSKNNVTCYIEELEGNLQLSSCDEGYIHKKTIMLETVVTEFDLVCERSFLKKVSISLFCLGMMFGGFVAGVMADIHGKKIIWLFSLFFASIFGVLCSYSTQLWMFFLCRFFIGSFVSSIILCVTVHVSEFVGSQHRPMIGIMLGVWNGIGYINLSIFAYYFNNWRSLQFAIALSFLPFIIVVLFIPESPRFLFSKGYNQRGKKICRLIGKINKKDLKKINWKNADEESLVVQQTSPFTLLLNGAIMRMVLRSFLLMFTSSLLFFFLTFSVGEMFGSVHLNQVFSGLVEFVSCLIVLPLVGKFGRRKWVVGGLTSSGTFLIAAEILKLATNESVGVKTAEVVLLMLAKLTMSPSFNLLFVYIAELFPTNLRNTASGMACVGARLASVLSPLLSSFSEQTNKYIIISVGILSLLTAYEAYLMPETKNIKMLSTVEEALYFYQHGKIIEINETNNNNKKENEDSKILLEI